MTLVVWTSALLGAAVYILVFFWEVLLFQLLLGSAAISASRRASRHLLHPHRRRPSRATLGIRCRLLQSCFLAPALSPA
jgi:hypothetical protein